MQHEFNEPTLLVDRIKCENYYVVGFDCDQILTRSNWNYQVFKFYEEDGHYLRYRDDRVNIQLREDNVIIIDKKKRLSVTLTELVIYKGDWGNPVDRRDVDGTMYDPETGEWTFFIDDEAQSEISSVGCIGLREKRSHIVEHSDGTQLQQIHYDMLIK